MHSVECPFISIKHLVKSTVLNLHQNMHTQVFSHKTCHKDIFHLPRRDLVLAQLWSGHCRKLAAYPPHYRSITRHSLQDVTEHNIHLKTGSRNAQPQQTSNTISRYNSSVALRSHIQPMRGDPVCMVDSPVTWDVTLCISNGSCSSAVLTGGRMN